MDWLWVGDPSAPVDRGERRKLLHLQASTDEATGAGAAATLDRAADAQRALASIIINTLRTGPTDFTGRDKPPPPTVPPPPPPPQQLQQLPQLLLAAQQPAV